jgi:hypothetical protein
VIRKDLKQLFCRQFACELFKTDPSSCWIVKLHKLSSSLLCYNSKKKWIKSYKLGEFNSSHQKMEALHDAMADSFTTMAAQQSGSFCLIIVLRRLCGLFWIGLAAWTVRLHQYCQGLNGGYTSLTYLWGSLRNMLRTGKWKSGICLIENNITTVWNIMILFQACKKRLYKMYGNGTWFFGVPVVLTQDRLDCFRLQPPQTVCVSFSWLHDWNPTFCYIVGLHPDCQLYL